MKKYIFSGEGYWYEKGNAHRGYYGIPPEIQKEREKNFEIEALLGRKRKNTAKKIIEEEKLKPKSLETAIDLLKRFGFKGIYVKNRKISLDESLKTHPGNLMKMYERTLKELENFVKNPIKESGLIMRLDTFK